MRGDGADVAVMLNLIGAFEDRAEAEKQGENEIRAI